MLSIVIRLTDLCFLQTSLDDVRGRANALKILQHLSEPSDVAASDWIVDRCKEIYVQGLPFGAPLMPAPDSPLLSH